MLAEKIYKFNILAEKLFGTIYLTLFLSFKSVSFILLSRSCSCLIQLEVEREAIESERKRMTEEEEKLLERKKEADGKLNAEMSELQLLRNDQVLFYAFYKQSPI